MRRFLFLPFFALIIASSAQSQYFGKNKVQYKDYHWQYLQSKHFNVYFHDGGRKIAEFVADWAESSYVQLKGDLRYELVDRITIVVFNGHNDFEENNIDLSEPQESVGGFTEFFKNRVVIPFEGDYEQLRHVLHHELAHAITMQMLYGAGVQSIITGMMRLQLPLWMMEGFAEYASLRWDTESDMFMRDAALNGYLPPIQMMYGFLNYKGGQNIFYYLAEKYGPEKIGEIFGKIKLSKSVERGLKQSIGIGIKELSKRWHKYVKKEYWPDIANRLEPEDFAKKLTDHVKSKNFVNNSPAISPRGDKIAFLSDRSDYFDIYLMSAIDGKILSRLVKGQRTMDLEELHWLRPGITWSPDGKKIAFAAKKGPYDVLHIVDVKRREIEVTYDFEFDGLYSPTWSPDGEKIAFMAVKNGRSDIYIFNLKTNRYRNMTKDIFSDLQPSWSPDGRWIAFVSDRGNKIRPEERENVKIQHENFRNHDLYLLDVETGEIRRITRTPYKERDPSWAPDGKRLVYSADKNGIFNLFVYNLETQENYPITNILTGAFQPHWVKNNLVFTAFFQGGYDIYMIKNPDEIKPGTIKLEDTNFIRKLKQGKIASIFATYRKLREKKAAKPGRTQNVDFRNFVFDRRFRAGDLRPPRKKLEEIFPDSSVFKLPSGEYIVNDYKVTISPDIIYGNAGYSQFFGVQGSTVIALSDVLGNHRIYIYTNLFYDLRNSDYQVAYYYLPKRTDFGIGVFHFTYYFLATYPSGFQTILRDRNYGFSGYISRPFDRYRRIDLSLTYLGINRKNLYVQWDIYRRQVLVGGIQYVKDTSLWGFTGPVNGERAMASFVISPKIGKYSLDFKTASFDYRRYFKISRDYNFVVRLAGGFSFGQNPQKFFVGGLDNWINYRVKGNIRVSVDDIYFSSFETPLRGADYYEQIGTRFFLTNIEFRFPFIRYFEMRVPPLILSNVRGALFLDMGAAWRTDRYFKFFSGDPGFLLPRLGTPIAGMGFGMRIYLGLFLLRYDLAWRTDFSEFSSRPRAYFSLGAEF